MKTVGDTIYSDSPISTLGFTLVWLGLMVLLLITWRVSYSHLKDWNLIIALVIAVLKALLVIWYFMDLRGSPKIVVLLFGMGLVMLSISGLLTMTDYLSRGNDRDSWGQAWQNATQGAAQDPLPPGGSPPH